MTDDELKAALTSRSVLQLTIWGESRGEQIESRIAVGCVARNRLAGYKRYRASEPTYRGVCLAPQQFSCWNGGDANYTAIMAQAAKLLAGERILDPILRECGWIADGLGDGSIGDRTGGSTFYVEKHLFEKAPPAWTTRVTQTCEIGSFVLFRDSLEKSA
jgi:cell wall hydrolase